MAASVLKRFALSWPVLPHPGSELSAVFLLDFLFFKESSGKVSDFFLNPTGSSGGLVAAPFYKCFALFRPVFPHLGSELSVVCFFGFLIL